MLLFLLLLNIVSLAIGMIALYKSNDAQKENIRIIERLCNHSESDLQYHKTVSKTLDLLCEYLKIEGDENA